MKSTVKMIKQWHLSLIHFLSIALISAYYWLPNNKYFASSAILFSIYSFCFEAYSRMKSKTADSGSMLQKFSDSFDEILDFSRNLYAQSDSLKKVIETEAGAVQASSSAVEEISSMLHKTASGAESLVQVSNEANQQIDKTMSCVNDLNQLMVQLKEISHSLNTEASTKLTELNQISDSMREIQSCTGAINDIVFQTKLLSFNASVEAARAGEAGRGFAVVSEEMGHLAKKSGDASLDIEKIVSHSLETTESRIKSVTNSLRDLTERTIKNLEMANARTAEVVESTEQIKNLFEKVTHMSHEISAATKEQDIGVREVSNSLHKLESSSRELAHVSKTTFDTSLTLSGRTEDLSKSIVVLSQGFGIYIKPRVKKFDFNSAISAHIDWKMKLTKYLQHPDGSLKPDVVCKDNACVLGKWIYGDGQVHKPHHLQTFEDLRASHAKFHQTAATIIRHIDSGNNKDAERLLSPSGEYSVISDKTVGLIKDLRDEVEGAASEQSKAA